MEGLKTNVNQVPLAFENEGIEKENHGSEFHHETISNVLEEHGHLSENVDGSNFVMFCPSSNLEARIGEAEKLIEKLNQHYFTISWKLEERTVCWKGGLYNDILSFSFFMFVILVLV